MELLIRWRQRIPTKYPPSSVLLDAGNTRYREISSEISEPQYVFLHFLALFSFSECECNEHAQSCTYDPAYTRGVCDSCLHNTKGLHCQECIDGYYHNTSVPLSDLNTCIREFDVVKCDSSD